MIKKFKPRQGQAYELRLAMYRGPAGSWAKQAWHRLVCAITSSQYSHCELVLRHSDQGPSLCASSSNRDGGVRRQFIDLASGRWDVFILQHLPDGTRDAAEHWFWERRNDGYDYLGLLRFVLPWRAGSSHRWICSEAVAAALGLEDPGQYSPQTLFERLVEGQ